MKYLIILLAGFLITSCERTTYELYINYQDGTKDTLTVRSHTYPTLDDGCIEFTEDNSVVCGVKSFSYKSF
jgi:hypothetical protein